MSTPKLLVQWICKSVIETGLDHSSIKILWSELVFLLLLNGISDDTWLGRGGPLQWWSEYRYLDGDARFIYIARELATWSEVNAFWRGLSSRFSFENCGIDSKLRIGVHWWHDPVTLPENPRHTEGGWVDNWGGGWDTWVPMGGGWGQATGWSV